MIAMKKNNFLKHCHIGRTIKSIAKEKQVASRSLANTIIRYQNNADKIYNLEDMDVGDVVKISYALNYNILEMLSDDHLYHLPVIENQSDHASYTITLDIQTESFIIKQSAGNSNFLSDIHIGSYIRRLAREKGWSTKHIAKKLHCAPNTVSDLYNRKSMKVKKLLRISDALGHNLIAEVYLSRMRFAPDLELFDQCKIIINEHKVRIVNPKDQTFSMEFRRQEDSV